MVDIGILCQFDLEPRFAHAAVVIVVLKHADAEAFVQWPHGFEHGAWHRDAEEGQHGNVFESIAVSLAIGARPGWHVQQVTVAHGDTGLVANRIGHRADQTQTGVRPQMTHQGG